LHQTTGETKVNSQLPKKVKVCPRCGSTNIHLSSKFDVWLMPKQYVCYDCHYIGPIVLELEEEKHAIKTD